MGQISKHYSIVQAVLNECTCKYEYEDNGVCQVLLNSLEWVTHNLGQERSLLLNEIVANEYAHINDEYTPWDSDKNGLVDDEALILSVTLGALGVFCFASRHGAESAKK